MRKIGVIAGIILVGLFIGSFRSDSLKPFPKQFGKPIYNFKNNPLSEAGFRLGRQLFYDPILSRDSSVSCASCHQSFAAFSHGDHALAHGIDSRIGKRNAPAILNIIWKKALMWDGGETQQELFPLHPITNALEMDFTVQGVIERLNHSERYTRKFKAVFGKDQINADMFFKALQQFTGSFISSNSKYDSVSNGLTTFTSQEQKGYQLYQRYCSVCHSEPLLGGNGFASNGLTMDPELQDSGRYLITHQKNDIGKFMIPSLRNVEITGPYMHDGRYKKLLEVIDHYNSLQGKSNIEHRLKMGGQLSEYDKRDLIAFLKTLTDRSFIYNADYRLPGDQEE